MLYPVHWSLSFLATVLRLGAGRGTKSAVNRPELSVLYEFEGCPWCRIAREAIANAGLSVLVRPCPKGGTRFRPDVQDLGGKAQFPYWVETADTEGLYESAAISKKVIKAHQARRPILHWLGPVNGILSSYATLLRLGAGVRVLPSRAQEGVLEFFGSEANPAARLVKERLCSLELEYIWHPQATDAVMLTDAATGKTLKGGRACLAYLLEAYAA